MWEMRTPASWEAACTWDKISEAAKLREQILDRAVLGNPLLGHLGRYNAVALGQILAQVLRQVCHLGEISHASMKPAEDLQSPEFRKALLRKLLLQLFQSFRFNIPCFPWRYSVFLHSSSFLRNLAT